MLKPTQQPAAQRGKPLRVTAPKQSTRPLSSTAEILSRGISLAEVLHVVRQLRPLVQEVS